MGSSKPLEGRNAKEAYVGFTMALTALDLGTRTPHDVLADCARKAKGKVARTYRRAMRLPPDQLETLLREISNRVTEQHLIKGGLYDEPASPDPRGDSPTTYLFDEEPTSVTKG